MNVQTISMDPRIARVHYADYRMKCKAHREQRAEKLKEQAAAAGKELGRIRIERTKLEKEDTELLKAYKALCKGQRLVDVRTAIVSGGMCEQKLPKLAICKADAEKCYFLADLGTMFLSPEHLHVTWGVKPPAFKFQSPGVPAELTNSEWRKTNNFPLRATALVPSVPPNLRPDKLGDYFILWEAEWTAQAPVDPILLSRVNSTMFAVVAQWDLTPLEQRMLESRL